VRRPVGAAAWREATEVRRGTDTSALDLDSQSPMQGGIRVTSGHRLEPARFSRAASPWLQIADVEPSARPA
jgi:hypothetical protein